MQPQKQSDKNQTESAVQALVALFAADMKDVNALILEHMQSDVPLIPQLASYLIASGGKRLRPLLTLATSQLISETTEPAQGLAAAVEFIHTATLLHDDVVDGSEQRRGQKAANLVFGNQSSVLVGDYLFSKAFQLMVQSKSLEALRTLSDAAAVIAEGEVMQLQYQGNLDLTWETYLEIIGAKTAALFAAACEVSAYVNNKPELAKPLYDYGYNLGIAFQIADDILDYDGQEARLGKDKGDDFYEGKLTAPVLFALEKASDDEMGFWKRTLEENIFREGDFETAAELVFKYNGAEQSKDIANTYIQKAQEALSGFQDNLLKETLLNLPTEILHRES